MFTNTIVSFEQLGPDEYRSHMGREYDLMKGKIQC